jgi:hypothetical protein
VQLAIYWPDVLYSNVTPPQTLYTAPSIQYHNVSSAPSMHSTIMSPSNSLVHITTMSSLQLCGEGIIQVVELGWGWGFRSRSGHPPHCTGLHQGSLCAGTAGFNGSLELYKRLDNNAFFPIQTVLSHYFNTSVVSSYKNTARMRKTYQYIQNINIYPTRFVLLANRILIC